jgi:hypothetical protein
MPNILSRREAETLNETIGLLRAIVNRTWHVGRDDTDVAMAAGRLAEAADVAADVLFNVLNVASNYVSDEEAVRMIENGQDARHGAYAQ